MRKSINILLSTTLIALFTAPISVNAAESAALPNSFLKLANSPNLAKPGILLIDPMTQSEVFASGSEVPRAPASILKLISATSAITAFGPDRTFRTSINATSDPSRFIMLGEFDPWLTTSSSSAKSFDRALSTKLIRAIEETGVSLSRVRIDYHGLYAQDIANLNYFYGNKLKFQKVSMSEVREAGEITKVLEVESPMLSQIIGFTLLWSDNTLADRLAKSAANEMGFGRDRAGLTLAFKSVMEYLDVYSEGLYVKDGSGLSHGNRVAARTIAELLWKIRVEPDYQAIYDGLPVSGKSGTLKNRFEKSAKSAVGLVVAKTGWINTSVTLAGYVEVDGNEYVFAIMANRINPTERSRELARRTIDKMLAKIAKPNTYTQEG
ncbi:MAG: D-alanyl-D-alanine carboxypeptidase [Actinomycetota bacterium]|tara:strand:+ start:26347 stop:27486 length:1140 start_codon:yes stop_codon:yes gene_type:complete